MRFIFRILCIFALSIPMISDFSGQAIPELKTKTRAERPSLFYKNFAANLSKLAEVGVDSRFQGSIKRGENLAQILTGQGVDYPTVLKLFSAVKGVYNLKLIHIGHPYGTKVQDGYLKEFWYKIDLNRLLKVIRDDGGNFSGRIEWIRYETKKEIIGGEIGDSLFQAILQIGEKPELADMLASLFEYDVDFNRDIRQGDRFVVLVEKKNLKGDFVAYGDLLAAKLVNAKKRIYLIRYTDPSGKTAYYHPDGRAVKKMFLRCPLPFLRLTSGYGFRVHPVLGFSAKHNGVDMAAPRGTAVRSTAGGVVIRIGFDRVRGKYLMAKHTNGYISHYCHLNRIQTGMKAGISIKQGQIIGTVGRTGRATGYHLHYGLTRNGRFINPMTLESPSLDPLKPAYLAHFKQYGAAVFFLLSDNQFLPVPEQVQDMFLRAVGQPSFQTGNAFFH